MPVPLSRLLLLALAGFLLAGRPAAAHPHVAVETEAHLTFDATGQIVGISHVWTFDEMYSSFALQGLDTNRDGQYSREELAELTKINVENLAQQKYFTVMRHERRFVSFGAVQDAWAEVAEGGKLRLHFTVPLATPFRGAGRPVTLEIYDPDFFVAFTPAEGEPMRLVSAPADCKLDYQPPRGGSPIVGTLSESFFQSLNSANFGQQFAGKFTVLCP
jgi:ABC-type uncharacterized transport system substrate-binding protein